MLSERCRAKNLDEHPEITVEALRKYLEECVVGIKIKSDIIHTGDYQSTPKPSRYEKEIIVALSKFKGRQGSLTEIASAIQEMHPTQTLVAIKSSVSAALRTTPIALKQGWGKYRLIGDLKAH